MKTSILKWLSCSLVVLLFCACAKTKIKNMKWGKYQMTMLCEYENGNRDTIYAGMFGPYISTNKEYYFFTPDIESRNKTKSLEIYIGGKNKKNEHIIGFLNSNFYNYSGYFFGGIRSYDIDKENFNIKYYIGKIGRAHV